MMTEEETARRAQDLVTRNRLVEAGFVMMMLCRATDGTTAEDIASVRNTFFMGAKYMFEVLHIKLPGEDAIEDLLDNLLAEFKKFEDSMPKGPTH